MRKEDQLSRIKHLMGYGMLVNESNNRKGSFEHHSIASDGKAYGIFRECSKYYIKSAPAEKENLAEAYDYIGGWNNRKDYEYESYANALKHFDLKMMSINEAYGAKSNAVTLDPSKKGDVIIEGTEKFKSELARQREIMFNTNVIIREGSYVGVGDPERVSGNNDADKPYTQKGEAKLDKDMPKATGKPESESDPYGDGKAPEKGKDVKDSDVLSNGKAVATEHPSGGQVTHVKNLSEGCEGDCAPNGARDWGTEGIGKGNGDPKQNGWEMEGQEYVNEEINDAKEWDEGLPGSAGTGEADTDHNNDPFNKAVNEAEDDSDEYDVEDTDGESKPENDVEGDDELGGEGSETDGEELGGEEELDLGADDEFGGEGEFGDGEIDDEFSDETDLEAEIAQLRAEVEALKAQLGGEEEAPVEPMGDELGGEDELGGDELGGEDEIDLGGDEENLEGPEETDLGGDEENPEDVDENRFTDAVGGAFRDGRKNPNGLDDMTPADKRRFVNYGSADAVGADDKHPVAHGVDFNPKARYNGQSLSHENDKRDPDAHADSLRTYNTAKQYNWGRDSRSQVAADSFVNQPGLGGKLGRAAMVGAAKLGSKFPKKDNGAIYLENLVNEVVESVINEAKNDAEWKKRFDTIFGGNPFNEKEMDKKFGKGAAKKAYGDTGKKPKDQKECVKEETTVLHDFGKHPGYRKKPMDLPPTGSDNVDGKRDWNDDSVHSEAPFGQSIGDGKPYEKLVQEITDRIMENIKKKA